MNNWHAFLNLFGRAGYLKGSIVASTNAVVFSYVLYLIGKYSYKVSPMELNRIIIKWIFMATITGFVLMSKSSWWGSAGWWIQPSGIMSLATQ